MNGHKLILVRESSGNRHYLADESVRCGTTLELQAVRYKYNNATDEERQILIDSWVSVRYEASLAGRAPENVRITLYTNVGGHLAVVEYWESMRFRWPRKDGD